MAFSGDTSTGVFSTRKLLESAARKAGVQQQRLTGETVEIANDLLYLIIRGILATEAVPSWCQDKVLMPFAEGDPEVVMPAGTVKTLNVNVVRSPAIAAAAITAADRVTLDFGAVAPVAGLRIDWAPNTPSVLERSADGVSWSTVLSVPATPYARQWLELPALISTRYLRLRAPGGALSAAISARGMPVEQPMGQFNLDEYAVQPSALNQSSLPVQYFLDRRSRDVVLRVWPAPNLTAADNNYIAAWRHRHIMLPGTLVQEIEVPELWYETLTYELATRLCLELPDAERARMPLLEAKANEMRNKAWAEDATDQPTRMQPSIGAYTA